MNATQAKQIQLTEYFKKAGVQEAAPEFQPKGGGEIKYHSPFAAGADSNPSLTVNTEKNAWYDFASGKGGNILDFVAHDLGLNGTAGNFKPILSEISAVWGDAPRNPRKRLRGQQNAIQDDPKLPDYFVVNPLKHIALKQYLESRGLKQMIHSDFVKQIDYKDPKTGKHYFTIGFANDSEGYETRNKAMKRVFGSKDITTIEGSKTVNSSELNHAVTVFEGFMDFLSWLEEIGEAQPPTTAIILNSTTQKDKAIEKIKNMDGIEEVVLYLDNDKNGKQTAEYMKFHLQEVAGLQVTDQSSHYAEFNDFNEYLIGKRQQSLGL